MDDFRRGIPSEIWAKARLADAYVVGNHLATEYPGAAPPVDNWADTRTMMRYLYKNYFSDRVVPTGWGLGDIAAFFLEYNYKPGKCLNYVTEIDGEERFHPDVYVTGKSLKVMPIYDKKKLDMSKWEMEEKNVPHILAYLWNEAIMTIYPFLIAAQYEGRS